MRKRKGAERERDRDRYIVIELRAGAVRVILLLCLFGYSVVSAVRCLSGGTGWVFIGRGVY